MKTISSKIAITSCFLFFAIATAHAADWPANYENSKKYFNDKEISKEYFLETDGVTTAMYPDNYRISKAVITEQQDAKGLNKICVLVAEAVSAGFFSKTMKLNAYYINLSKIKKIESLGRIEFSNDPYYSEAYTLDDGTIIKTVVLKSNGVVACGLDENNALLTAPLKWTQFHGKEECAFTSTKAEMTKPDNPARFPQFEDLYLGFGQAPRGFSRMLSHNTESIKPKFEKCAIAAAQWKDLKTIEDTEYAVKREVESKAAQARLKVAQANAEARKKEDERRKIELANNPHLNKFVECVVQTPNYERGNIIRINLAAMRESASSYSQFSGLEDRDSLIVTKSSGEFEKRDSEVRRWNTVYSRTTGFCRL